MLLLPYATCSVLLLLVQELRTLLPQQLQRMAQDFVTGPITLSSNVPRSTFIWAMARRLCSHDHELARMISASSRGPEQATLLSLVCC